MRLKLLPSALITYRLWCFHQNSTAAGSARAIKPGASSETLARHTIRIIIESGTLQSATLLLVFISVLAKSNVAVIASTLVSIANLQW
jgi:hypothetical protein